MKHRSNVFVVERRVITNHVWEHAVIGVFLTYEGADNYAGACTQQFRERGFDEDDFTFYVTMSTYYNE